MMTPELWNDYLRGSQKIDALYTAGAPLPVVPRDALQVQESDREDLYLLACAGEDREGDERASDQ